MSELFNPWTLPRPETREDERDYTDRRHPGVTVRIRFRELNPFSEGQALRLYGEYWEKWVKPKTRAPGQEPTAQVLPAPVPILLNEVILDQIVTLQAMQVPTEAGSRYGLLEWAGFAANMPDAFREMLKTCRVLNDEPEQERGNVSEPESTSGEASSSPLSNSDNLTQNGSSSSPDASDQSPEACAGSANGSESPLGTSERTQDKSIFASSATLPR